MDQQNWLTERFEENRPRLRGVAYRMLGSLSEAEDAVQEAWLRLNRIDTATVDNLGGWLTTVVSRVCLDLLRSRKSFSSVPNICDSASSILCFRPFFWHFYARNPRRPDADSIRHGPATGK